MIVAFIDGIPFFAEAANKALINLFLIYFTIKDNCAEYDCVESAGRIVALKVRSTTSIGVRALCLAWVPGYTRTVGIIKIKIVLWRTMG